jgi:GH24 family phage-related lysozyme (muramidase)
MIEPCGAATNRGARMPFSTDNRILPLWETCSFDDVPIFRALALALDQAREAGASFTILSADRRDAVLATFNARHGTHLHGQGFLYEHQHDPGFYPANRPGTTSHCLFADGNPAYRVGRKILAAGAKLPRYFLGIDACDTGPGCRANDCSTLVGTLERLGYHVTRPYHSGSEAHHFSFTSDPTPVLRHHRRITEAAAGVVAARRPKPRPQPARPVGISTKGAAFIAQFEGFVPTIYDDAANPPNATVGFGHVVHSGKATGKEPLRKISRAQALELLRADCRKAAAAVAKHVAGPLTQAQFDALVSFTYNCGEGSLTGSTLLLKLNAGDYAAVPAELEKWTHAGPGKPLPGLVRRRRAEAELFTRGTYA